MVNIREEVAFGFIDQVLISLMHFCIGLFFIKLAPKHDYGLYSIAFATILLAVGLSNAIITTQMTVNTADRPQSQKDVYCYEMLLAQALIVLPAILLVWISILILYFFSIVDKSTAIFIFIVAFTVVGVLIHDFFRRLFFLKLRPHFVLLIDSVRLLFLSSLTVCFLKSEIFLNFHSMMITGYGLSAILSGYIGYKMACLPVGSSFSDARNALFEAWLHGKWATAGVIVTWLQNQSYTYLLAFLSGTSSIADANAARLFFAPISMLTTSFASIFMPRFSIMRSQGEMKQMASQSQKIMIIIFAVVVGYGVIVFLLKNLILQSVFPGKYQNIMPLIFAWMFYFLFQSIRTNSSLLLQVLKKFKYITISSSVTSAVVILICVILIHFYGVMGNILGMAAGELVLAIILWRVFVRSVKQ